MFHSENEISPCVDLLLGGPAEDGSIDVFCYVAGYTPAGSESIGLTKWVGTTPAKLALSGSDAITS